MLKKTIEPLVQKHLQENKLLVLVGPKGNQRTELILKLSMEENSYLIDASKSKIRKEIEAISFEVLIEKMAEKKHLVIHEAQLLENLQSLIEFVLFERDDISLSCSCSFLPYLQVELIEALETQGLILVHHSPTFQELAASYGLPQLEKTLDDRLIFGNMEEVMQHPESAVTYLNQQLTSILETQISKQDRINKKDKLLKLLQYISFNIGEHLSYNEIGSTCGLDNETVERYINLLEKSFVLVKIPVFYNEQKYELKKAHCFYFYDTGIRNACINNFNSLEMRFDANQLWKNWLIVEKIKNEVQTTDTSQFFFWKTHTRQQVDFIQINSTMQKAFQFQYNKKEKCKFPTSFLTYYPTIKTSVINKSTYWSFLAK